jgi:hypothetical protein
MQRTRYRYLFFPFVAILMGLVTSCAQEEPRLEPLDLREALLEQPELIPVLKQHHLNTKAAPEGHREVTEIEEADSKLYGPIAAATIFVKSSSPTFDSEGLKPWYWLRVEDYQTAEMAARRASEYHAVGSYERIARAYQKADRFILSKTSVRQWAVARGRRVYALTTNVYLFTLIELPENLRKSISALPET